jgi:hypothetical protein
MGYSERMSWAAAREQCRSQGMELASVASAAQDQALVAAMKALTWPQQSHYWLGGTDRAAEGSWAWSDGSAWSYSNWHPVEPNGGVVENCAMVYIFDIGVWWNDLSCAQLLGFACKAAGACRLRPLVADEHVG